MHETVIRHPLYLVGCGGLAREVYGWLVSENSLLLERLVGFVVTDDHDTQKTVHNLPVVHVDDIEGEFGYLMTISSPITKEKVFMELSDKRGASVETFISSSSIVGLNVSIGQGAIINPRCSISSDVEIGKLALVNCNTGIGHDVVIGDNCSILGSVSINGNVIMGDRVLVGSGVIIHPGKKIGAGATIGMGSVVFRNVRPECTVLGNPAKVI